MNQEQRDNLAASLGITPEEQISLDAGSNHPFTCRCETCRKWWVLCGPENEDEADEPGYVPKYGPFTQAEIEGAP